MLGGGMRQAGLLAAAGLYALTHHRDDLVVDNARAHAFAEGLTALENVTIDPSLVQSNIVIFHIKEGSAESICECLAPDMLVLPMGKGRVRAVFHRDLPSDVVGRALELMKQRVG